MDCIYSNTLVVGLRWFRGRDSPFGTIMSRSCPKLRDCYCHDALYWMMKALCNMVIPWFSGTNWMF